MSKHIIIMGVSGCGKSTVGELLAEEICAVFYDGDDCHPQSNLDKMASGTPLNDADRKPWLEKLVNVIKEGGTPSVTACSALKKQYRETLRTAGDILVVYLQGDRELLLERLTERSRTTDHFMSADLLDSQLETLEDPSNEEGVVTISIADNLQDIITQLSKVILSS